MSAHSPLPWRRVDCADYAEIHNDETIGIQAIALVGRADDADSIILAVNAHAELVAALRKAATYVELCYSEEGGEEAAEAKHDLDMINVLLAKLDQPS